MMLQYVGAFRKKLKIDLFTVEITSVEVVTKSRMQPAFRSSFIALANPPTPHLLLFYDVKKLKVDSNYKRVQT